MGPLQSMHKEHLSLLLIEDNFVDALLTFKAIQQETRLKNVSLSHFHTMGEAEKFIANNKDIDLILLDLGLPDTKGGMDSFAHIQSIAPNIPVVVLTGTDNAAMAFDLVKSGAEELVVKGHNKRLKEAIDFALCRHKLLAALKHSLNGRIEAKEQVISRIKGNYSCN